MEETRSAPKCAQINVNYANHFREIVAGERRGLTGSLLRAALRAIEVPYTWGTAWRNYQFDIGQRAARSVGVPVISVGNLSLGGTGKTPMVKWLATWLRGQGLRVVIVSRGYGTSAGTANDEALELQQSLPDVPHVQNRDRVAAARIAVEQWDAQVILADDAFQHRRLARDLDIVLIDCLEPFGYGHLFPRGTLREPIASLRRADGVCLTRVDMVHPDRRDRIRSQIQNIVPELPCCEASHKPSRLIDHHGQVRALDELAGVSVAAFCGIGNPHGFRHTLLSTGCDLVGWREFGDHHHFQPDDLDALTDWVRASGAEEVVCTHKDLVKLPVERIAEVRLSAVVVELEILRGQQALEQMLRIAITGERGNPGGDVEDCHLGTMT